MRKCCSISLCFTKWQINRAVRQLVGASVCTRTHYNSPLYCRRGSNIQVRTLSEPLTCQTMKPTTSRSNNQTGGHVLSFLGDQLEQRLLLIFNTESFGANLKLNCLLLHSSLITSHLGKGWVCSSEFRLLCPFLSTLVIQTNSNCNMAPLYHILHFKVTLWSKLKDICPNSFIKLQNLVIVSTKYAYEDKGLYYGGF